MDKEQRRKEISEFAKRIIELAEIAPDEYARKDLYRMLHFIRQRYAIPPEIKKLEILNRIIDGATTYAQLLQETGYSKHQLGRGLKELLTEKKIREVKVLRPSGAGRPLRGFFPESR